MTVIDALRLEVVREGELWHLSLRLDHPEGGDALPKLGKELLVAGMKATGFTVQDDPRHLLVEKRFHSLSEALAEVSAPLQGIKMALDARRAKAAGAQTPPKTGGTPPPSKR